MFSSADTIAAIATPPGLGGIAILRVSGPEAGSVLRALFTPSRPLASGAFRPRFMHHGHCLDADGRRLDEALAVFMPAPHSFTGEDTAEIHCHGGMGVTAALLEASLAAGARPALPGEFTRRAFLNGRLDLTRAEAVAEMIAAPTRQGVRLAAAKLDGLLAGEIRGLRQATDALRVQALAAMDFPDEALELLPREALLSDIEAAAGRIARLLAAFERARLWREGASAVLAGPVNAGKSSLLNALLGRERAIVSPEPGTTRDSIEESVNLGGLPLRLTDTAGLRAGGGVIEAEGIRRSHDLANAADLVLLVGDITARSTDHEREFLRRNWDKVADGRLILVFNKSDLLDGDPGERARSEGRARLRAAAPEGLDATALEEALRGCPCLALSAKSGLGLDALAACLRRALTEGASGGAEDGTDDVAPNLRQSRLLRAAHEELRALDGAVRQGMGPEIASAHLDAAARLLDEVTGASGAEELLDMVFADFCIGK